MVKGVSDQKEYLKKYLTGTKKHSKKKKSDKKLAVKLIDDDDEDFKSLNQNESDFLFDGEDAPQIVLGEGVESLAEASTNKWKKLSDTTHDKQCNFVQSFSGVGKLSKLDESLKGMKSFSGETLNFQEIKSTFVNKTLFKRDLNTDLSPRRQKHSITRKKIISKGRKVNVEDDSDLSPLRCEIEKYSGDLSPRRKQKQSKTKDEILSKERRVNVEDDYDLSPVRRHIEKDDVSKKHKFFEKNFGSKSSDDLSPIRKNHRNTDSKHVTKTVKMADGKKSGLRNAEELRKDLKEIKDKEEKEFKASIGRVESLNELKVRSNIRHKQETLEDQIQNEKKQKENKKKQEAYSRWGKGVKQLEDYKLKMKELEHESNKPLARYADDKDLDKMLKSVERVGDPMLEYLRSKKQKEKINRKQTELPIYKGNYPENRFGIRPGYRWDGVDRSNGYEKKYFEKQNSKRAMEEEAYRYSTEDM